MMEIEETLSDEQQQRPRLRELRQPWLIKLFLIGIGIAAIQQPTGVNTIMYYAPTMLKAVGMSNDAALFATIANGAVSVLMTFGDLAAGAYWPPHHDDDRSVWLYRLSGVYWHRQLPDAGNS